MIQKEKVLFLTFFTLTTLLCDNNDFGDETFSDSVTIHDTNGITLQCVNHALSSFTETLQESETFLR